MRLRDMIEFRKPKKARVSGAFKKAGKAIGAEASTRYGRWKKKRTIHREAYQTAEEKYIKKAAARKAKEKYMPKKGKSSSVLDSLGSGWIWSSDAKKSSAPRRRKKKRSKGKKSSGRKSITINY